jgi:photosystem II stability/assembly factor-like uncharacterized protein
MKLVSVLSFLLFFFFFANAQQIKILTDSSKISLRGLSVVNDNVIWASGSSGKVARSIDGGKNFEWITVKGYEQRDFRDIEAFDANTALIMAVAEPAVMLKTKDGGKTWKEVFHNDTKGMFLDAIDFDGKIGCVIGDPVSSKAFQAISFDSGETWKQATLFSKDSLSEGEAFFAASGTNIKMYGSHHGKPEIYCVSGGKESNFYADNKQIILPVIQGKESTGANSIAAWDKKHLIVVGGDFANDKDSTGNCVYSDNSGKTWLKPKTSPHGYRSCVAYITKNKLICCGTSGVDISNDGGLNWKLISNESFNVCAKAKKGAAVFLAGRNGTIAMIVQ